MAFCWGVYLGRRKINERPLCDLRPAVPCLIESNLSYLWNEKPHKDDNTLCTKSIWGKAQQNFLHFLSSAQSIIHEIEIQRQGHVLNPRGKLCLDNDSNHQRSKVTCDQVQHHTVQPWPRTAPYNTAMTKYSTTQYSHDQVQHHTVQPYLSLD